MESESRPNRQNPTAGRCGCGSTLLAQHSIVRENSWALKESLDQKTKNLRLSGSRKKIRLVQGTSVHTSTRSFSSCSSCFTSFRWPWECCLWLVSTCSLGNSFLQYRQVAAGSRQTKNHHLAIHQRQELIWGDKS